MIIDRLNAFQDSPPFLMISEVREISGPYVMPTPWESYFSGKNRGRSFLYDGRFDNARDVNKARGIQRDIVAIINRDPLWENKKTSSMREFLPIEISADKSILPYDPANAFELAAILNSAIRRRRKEETFYVSAYGGREILPEPNVVVREEDVVRGVYLYRIPEGRSGDARIIASGKTLPVALKVARWVEEKTGVFFEVWSCPSYTMISRSMEESYKQSLCEVRGEHEVRHVSELFLDDKPTISMTQYDPLINEQVASLFRDGFMAIGRANGSNEIEFNEVISKCLYHLMRCGNLSRGGFKSAMAGVFLPLI